MLFARSEEKLAATAAAIASETGNEPHWMVGDITKACDFISLVVLAKPFLRQVSVSGATVGGKSWGQLIQPLGAGDFDQVGLLKILDSIEFSGPVGLQCYNIKGEPMDFLKKSITSWNLLSEAK